MIVNDNVVEPDETFRLSVTSSDDRVHMICPGTVFTILNDDSKYEGFAGEVVERGAEIITESTEMIKIFQFRTMEIFSTFRVP